MATLLTNLVGRTARPSVDSPWCWPWAYHFEPKGAALAETPREALDPAGRFKRTLFAERAEVVAARADKDGVKLTLENLKGEMSEVFASSVALVPRAEDDDAKNTLSTPGGMSL